MGPRINAAGRLERAMMAVEMLTTDDTALAREIAEELDRCNTRRQEIEQTIVAEAHEMIRAQGGLGDRGRDRPGTPGLAPRRHRDRGQPPGRDLPPARRS